MHEKREIAPIEPNKAWTARDIPVLLRTLLNVVAIVGVGATLMGWIQREFGIFILVCAPIYVFWEIYPWVSQKIDRRPRVTLAVFIVCGAVIGGLAWWACRVLAPPVQMIDSASVEIFFGPNQSLRGTDISDTSEASMRLLLEQAAQGQKMGWNFYTLTIPANQNRIRIPITLRNNSETPIQNATVTIYSTQSLQGITSNPRNFSGGIGYSVDVLKPYKWQGQESTFVVEFMPGHGLFGVVPLLVTVDGAHLQKTHGEAIGVIAFAVPVLPKQP